MRRNSSTVSTVLRISGKSRPPSLPNLSPRPSSMPSSNPSRTPSPAGLPADLLVVLFVVLLAVLFVVLLAGLVLSTAIVAPPVCEGERGKGNTDNGRKKREPRNPISIFHFPFSVFEKQVVRLAQFSHGDWSRDQVCVRLIITHLCNGVNELPDILAWAGSRPPACVPRTGRRALEYGACILSSRPARDALAWIRSRRLIQSSWGGWQRCQIMS